VYTVAVQTTSIKGSLVAINGDELQRMKLKAQQEKLLVLVGKASEELNKALQVESQVAASARKIADAAASSEKKLQQLRYKTKLAHQQLAALKEATAVTKDAALSTRQATAEKALEASEAVRKTNEKAVEQLLKAAKEGNAALSDQVMAKKAIDAARKAARMAAQSRLAVINAQADARSQIENTKAESLRETEDEIEDIEDATNAAVKLAQARLVTMRKQLEQAQEDAVEASEIYANAAAKAAKAKAVADASKKDVDRVKRHADKVCIYFDLSFFVSNNRSLMVLCCVL
jgi:chromosome segregation ATPase